MKMAIDDISGRRLLLYRCSFTCIYFPGILTLLKFNNNLYNVGTYKFIPILVVLTFAEVTKLSFSLLLTERSVLNKIESQHYSRSKKSWTKTPKEGLKFFFAAFVLSVVYYVMVVLFGAPLLSHHEETIMLAVTLTTLTFVPISLHLGVDTALSLLTGTHVQSVGLFVQATRTNVRATLLGAWLGAIVIPLDWDRPWQAWPVPCITGALIGYTVAHFITLVKMLPILKSNRKLHR